MGTTDKTIEEMAEDRVMDTPEIRQYYTILIEYTWPEQEEHWEWVDTAPVEEIISWAKRILSEGEVTD